MAVAAGESHSLGVKTDGTLWAWGLNDNGQVGDDSTRERNAPVLVGEGFTRVAAGSSHSLALGADGGLWAWGGNAQGQLGDGTWEKRLTPVRVGEGFVDIAAAGNHSLGLKADGTLWSWGQNDRGQVGDGSTLNRSTPVQVSADRSYYAPYTPATGDFALGFGLHNESVAYDTEYTLEYLSNDGLVLNRKQGSIPAGGHVSLMNDLEHTQSGWARITSQMPLSGMALVFGLGPDPMFDMDITNTTAKQLLAPHVETAAGWTSWLMLANPGDEQANVSLTLHPGDGALTQTAELSIPATGAVQYELNTAFPEMAGALSIDSDQGLAGFVLYDGRAKDFNWAGGLSIVPLAEDEGPVARRTRTSDQRKALSVAAGSSHSLVLMDDGTLWAWGANSSGQLGDGTGMDSLHPVLVGEGFAAVASGENHSLGVKTDGTLWAWGWNHAGEVGDGSSTTRFLPVQVGEGFVDVAGGWLHSLGLKADGTLWGWGLNTSGQLGGGLENHQQSPVQIGEEYSAIAAGYEHSLGIKADGALWAWGRKSSGLVGEDFVTMAGGMEHSLGIKSDASLWAWGSNGYGQLGRGSDAQRKSAQPDMGPALATVGVGPYEDGHARYGDIEPSPFEESPIQVGEGFADVSAGWIHSLFVKTDGSLWASGYNYNGQVGDGTQENCLSMKQIGEDFVTVSAGYEHSLGIKTDGTLWAWGRNEYGQLGDGTQEDRLAPVQVDLPSARYSIPPGDFVYQVPWLPPEDEFALGFGLSNVPQADPTDVYVEYYDNAGLFLGREDMVIPASGHLAFMAAIQPAVPGWVRISASAPIHGMALAFGLGQDPLFDMDIKTPATELSAAHVDTGSGWVSKAMFANPSALDATVTVSLYPDSGMPVQETSLVIPAMGAVQYDLSEAFPDVTGSLEISSDQGLAGFILYDGRGRGENYIGGLSMVAVE